MNNRKNRAYLLGIAGGYLGYLAYELFRDRNLPDTTMTPLARWLFIGLFVLCGAGLVIYAVISWIKAGQEKQDAESDNPDSLK